MKRQLPIIILVFALLPFYEAAADEINVMCPVLQDQEATSDYSVVYKGKEIRFCCSECVMEFEKHPEIYENVLPQLQNISVRSQIQLFLGDHGGLAIGSLLLAVLIGLRIYRYKNPVAAGSQPKGFVNKRISPAIPLLVLCGYLGYEVYSLQAQIHQTQLEDEIHFATFYDFGYPPVPRRPETEPRLAGSFYRGNDERSPKLFNNGNYRTAKFNVSICDADRVELQPGDDVSGKDLFLKFEVERPPFTPDFLYNQEMMGGMFLTTECDRFLGKDAPVADAVGLTETETMQRWEALYPIRAADACGCTETKGTVYVCEEYMYQPKISFLSKKRGGSRFHYGVRYELDLKDGIVQGESDMYMGALYRTRKLPTWRVPMSQWFSHEPIPELPSRGSDDPELLGITDHVARKNGDSPR